MSAIQDAYNQIGADFSDVLRRFTSEKLIVRFAEKFLEDGSFEQLGEALRSGNADAAFLASHTLKGVSQNMGFTGLYEPSNALTEELRAKPADFTRAKELFEPVKAEYGKTARHCAPPCSKQHRLAAQGTGNPLRRSVRCGYRAERAYVGRIRYHCFVHVKLRANPCVFA